MKDLKGSSYTRRSSKVTYLYLGGALRPVGCNDVWFESEKLEFKYRGVPVEYIEILEADEKTFRCFKVLNVGFSNMRVWVPNHPNEVPNPSNYKKSIDVYIEAFQDLVMESTEVDLECIYRQKYPKSIRSPYCETHFETAVRWLVAGPFSKKIRRGILKHLIMQGMSKDEAICFYGDIY